MTSLKIGDRIVITNPMNQEYNEQGTIKAIYNKSNRWLYLVALPFGENILFYSHEIELVSDSSTDITQSNDTTTENNQDS